MATPNPFDQFDTPRSGANPFDRFDEQEMGSRAGNVFDQFDEQENVFDQFDETASDEPADTTALNEAQRRANAEAMTHRTPAPLPPALVAAGRLPGNILKSIGAQTTQMIAGGGQAFQESRQADALREAAFVREKIPAFTRRADELESAAITAKLRGDEFAGTAAEARIGAREAIPEDASFGERAIQQGASSAAVALPAIMAAGPVGGASLLGLGAGGSRYSELRAAGKTQEEAARSGKLLGALEGLTEFLPAVKLVKGTTGWKNSLVQFLVREIPGENVMTVAQMVDDLGHGLRDDITGRELLDAIKETTAATAVGGGAQYGAARFLHEVGERAARRPAEQRGANPFDMFDAFADVPSAAGRPVQEPTVGPAPVELGTATPFQESPVAEPFTPKPPGQPVAADDPFAPSPLGARPLSERIADPKIQEQLVRMRDETGWAEVGGRLIRNEATGEAIGRTTWIPRAEWWRERPKGLTEGQARIAIGKALAGKPLTQRETQLLEFMTEVAETRRVIDPLVPTPQELGESGLTPSGHDAFESALVARATEIDELAVERAAIQYDNDPNGFLTEIRRIVRQGARPDEGRAAGARTQEAAAEAFDATQAIRTPRRGIQTDLFGGRSETAQQIFDREQERQRRERRAPPIVEGPGDLFTGSNPQTDIEDGVQRMSGTQYTPLLQALPNIAKQTAITVAPGTSLERSVPIPQEPIRREHILKEFQRLFGVKVYQGKPYKVRTALGFFRPHTGEVRIKAHNDLEVTAHEVFHWLDRNFPAIRKLYHRPQFSAELRGVSYDAKKLFEGFAEFGRLFMTQADQAAARTPEFYKAFIAETQRAGILGKLLRIQERMHQWYYQGAEARARSKIGTTPPSLREQFAQATDRLPDRILQQSLDALQGFKVVERDIAGKVQDATLSPYKMARLVAGARGVAKAVLNHGTVAWSQKGDITFTGKGLKQIFDPIADVLDDAMAYFVGRRAQELVNQGREKLFTPEEIRALLNVGEQSPKGKEIRKAFVEYQAFLNRMLDFYEQSGLISGGSRTLMSELNRDYVPFHRIVESLEKGEARPAQGAFRRLRGGTQNLRDIFENITGSVQALTAAALRNHTKQALYGLIESSRNGAKYAVRVKTEKHATRIDPQWVLRQLNDLIEDNQLAKQAVEAIAHHPKFGDKLLYWSGRYAPSAPDLDMVLVKGEPRYYQIGDPILMETLEQFNTPKPLGLALRVLGGFANVLRRGVTLAPDFQIPNLLRDTFNAFTLSKGKQWVLIDSLRGMVARMRNDSDYWAFLANGGGFSSQLHGETQALRTRLERYYVARGIDYRTVIDTPQKMLDVYDELASAFEYGTRLAEFKRLRQRGGSAREAAYEGREISTDFAMRGASDFLRAFTVSVPFLNARLQGLYRLQREAFERDGRLAFNPEQTFRFTLRAVAGIMLPSMALWWYNHDDERYKALPEWIKLTHWVILHPKGAFLIPKPFEVGAMFATVPEQTLEYLAERDGTKYAEALAFLAANALSLNPTPHAVKPLIDVARNKQWSGSPIIPEAL